MSLQLALTDPCVSYLMKTGETNQDSLSQISYPRLMSMQLALTAPCASYLTKTGD